MAGNEPDSTAHWVVYIVACADASLYTGITNALERRVAAHNAGNGARYTRARRPVTLVYSESAENRSAALKRELAIKRLPAAGKRRLISAQRAPA